MASMLESGLGNRVFSVVYDNESSAWGPQEFISPDTQPNVAIPTVVSSRSREHTEVYYWVRGGIQPGIYSRAWISAEDGWSDAVRVRGSARAYIPQAGATTAYPIVIDDSGDATLPFYQRVQIGDLQLLILRMSRRENGVWQRPARVLVQSDFEALIAELADADYSASGNVTYAFKLPTPGQPTTLYTVRFDADTRSWTTEPIYSLEGDSAQRVRVAYLDQARAIATYLDSSIFEYSSRVFDGNIWLPASGIPGGPFGVVHETVVSDGECVLVGDELTNEKVIVGTWFRDASL
ncbi:MAG: hypothetical protein AAGA68_22700 [Pseudomonadota bacterium]